MRRMAIVQRECDLVEKMPDGVFRYSSFMLPGGLDEAA